MKLSGLNFGAISGNQSVLLNKNQQKNITSLQDKEREN